MKNSAPILPRRYSSEERQHLLDLYRTNQWTQGQFAREHGLKLSTFRQWLYRPKKRTKPGAATPSGFQEVLLGAPSIPAGWVAEVCLASGTTVRLGQGATPELIDQLLRRVRRLC